MKKKYLKLTEEQKARGVIFSSQLQPGGIIYEVFSTDPPEEQKRTINLLLDDSFLKNSPFKYNEVRN